MDPAGISPRAADSASLDGHRSADEFRHGFDVRRPQDRRDMHSRRDVRCWDAVEWKRANSSARIAPRKSRTGEASVAQSPQMVRKPAAFPPDERGKIGDLWFVVGLIVQGIEHVIIGQR
jgi:hypothetical protein